MAEQGAQLPNSYESMYERAQALARSGDPGAATEVLERILARLGRLSDETLRQNQGLASFAYRVGLDLSGLLAGRGSYDQAAAVIGALPRFAPDEVANLERRAALVLAAKGDLDQALATLTSLTERLPDRPLNWFGLAEVQIARQQYDEAASSLDRAESIATEAAGQALLQHRRFVLLSAQQRLPEALAAWDRMTELQPLMADWRARELYNFLLQSGTHEQLRQYLRRDKSKSRADFYRGLLDYADGNFAAGKSRWEGLLKNDPSEDPFGAQEWAEAALRLGKNREATTVLLAATQEASTPRAMLLLGIAASRSSQVEHAQDLLRQGTRMLRAAVPRAERYGPSDWELFTSLVDKRELWPAVSEYFDTGDGE